MEHDARRSTVEKLGARDVGRGMQVGWHRAASASRRMWGAGYGMSDMGAQPRGGEGREERVTRGEA